MFVNCMIVVEVYKEYLYLKREAWRFLRAQLSIEVASSWDTTIDTTISSRSSLHPKNEGLPLCRSSTSKTWR
jgi:hypothetical protein